MKHLWLIGGTVWFGACMGLILLISGSSAKEILQGFAVVGLLVLCVAGIGVCLSKWLDWKERR